MTVREIPLAVVCLSLLVPLSALGQEPGIAPQDDWFGQDKALHYGISVGLAGAGYAGGALLFEAPEARWLSGAGVALGAGVAKELYDAGRGTFFSFKDLTWDVLGTATGLGLSWAVDRLVFQRDGGTPSGQGSGAGLPGGRRPLLAVSVNAGGHPQGGPGDGRNASVVLLLLGGW
jgi:putative lipoprotein